MRMLRMLSADRLHAVRRSCRAPELCVLSASCDGRLLRIVMIPWFGPELMCGTGQGSLLAHGTNDSLEDVLRRSGVSHRLAQREICGTHVANKLGTHDTLSYMGDDIS